MASKRVEIDPFFESLLQPLAEDEFKQLEASVTADGCRDPLVAWDGTDPPTLLDGHNRKRICEKNHLEYELRVLDLPSWDAARNWVIANQLARRNITPDNASYLRGLRYEAEKAEHGGDRPSCHSDNLKTCERLAQEYGVGPRTINRDGKFAAAIGFIEENAGKAIHGLSRGPSKCLRRSETVKVSRAEPKVQKETVKLLVKGVCKNYREVQAEFARRKLEAAAEKFGDLELDDCVDPRTWEPQPMQELLPALSDVDAIITDPPYPEEFLPLYGELARLAKQCLKPDGVLAVMCGQSFLPQIIADMSQHIEYRWTMAYLTPGGQAVQLWDRKVNTFWKPVLLFGSPGTWIGDVLKSKVNDNDKRFHNWGQSESGMADFVERLSKPGDLVCDPFMGGGTTGVVSIALSRRFVGCDIDPAHVANARTRMQLEKGLAANA